MTSPGWSLKPRPAAPSLPARLFWMIVLGAAIFGAITMAAHADCFDLRMKMIAQECADQLARQDHLHHCGSKGQRAENVAYGYATKAKTLAQWERSPGHAANMRLPGCRAVASAKSRSGRIFWVMEIAW